MVQLLCLTATFTDKNEVIRPQPYFHEYHNSNNRM